MPCIINNTNFSSFGFSSLANCQFNVGGITNLWITSYRDLTNKFKVYNNTLLTIDDSLQFFELPTKRQAINFVENKISNDQFEQILTFSIDKMEPSKQLAINNLIKNKLLALFKDANGSYWIMGIDSGIKNTSYKGQTGNFNENNNYTFEFKTTTKNNLYSVSESYVSSVIYDPLDCDNLDTEKAVTCAFNIYDFENCIIGEITGWTN